MTLKNGKYINAFGIEHWYQNGQYHRDGGPAFTYPNGEEHWYQLGNLHRDSGPASVYIKGNICWYNNGMLLLEDVVMS